MASSASLAETLLPLCARQPCCLNRLSVTLLKAVEVLAVDGVAPIPAEVHRLSGAKAGELALDALDAGGNLHWHFVWQALRSSQWRAVAQLSDTHRLRS